MMFQVAFYFYDNKILPVITIFDTCHKAQVVPIYLLLDESSQKPPFNTQPCQTKSKTCWQLTLTC